jgi:hypothetical protein
MKLKGPSHAGHLRRWMQLEGYTVAIRRNPLAYFLPLSALLLVLIQSGCAGYTTKDAVPSIITQPANQTVTAGQTAIFSVSASGTAPLSYQWNINGIAISGATFSSYTTPPETTSGSGARFTVIVSNSAGNATSNAAMLTVSASPSGVPLQIATSSLPLTEVGIQFQAVLSATGGVQPYRWSVVSGSLPAALSLNPNTGTLSGTPSQEGQFDFSVQASDSSSPNPQTAVKALILSVVPAVQITPGALPNGEVGVPFQALVTATGGVPPYNWTVAGALPPGLSLNNSSGAIAGTPTQGGTSTFTILLTDSAGHSAQKSSSITITAAGPALPTLPQATVDLTMPTQTGTIRNVSAGDSAGFQNAINASTCGDTIVLVAGSTYNGNFTIPSTSCSGWIEIQSSAMSNLPSSGNRVGPSDASNMAIISTSTVAAALAFLPNSNHWRVMGIEFTTSVTPIYTLVKLGFTSDGSNITVQSQLPNQIIFDRNYIFGGTGTSVQVVEGIFANTQAFAIVDSYCDGIVDNSGDAQCIESTNGSGPFLIQNNFLQATGENIMFGGADPGVTNLVPSDITVVGNLIQKNVAAWRGVISDVKNLFELKNAQRVLLDGNVLQYTWAAGQEEAIILRSANQNGACTWCVVQDVTVTHNLIQHAPMGIVMTPIAGPETTNPALPTGRILVRNNVFDDISATNWGGGSYGTVFQVLSNSAYPIMHDITIDHNTGFPDVDFLYFGVSGTVSNTQFSNNISNYALYGVAGDGFGPGIGALNAYAPNYIYNDTVLINSTGATPGGVWPTGTIWSSLAGVGFTSYSGTPPNLSGNFQLTSHSPYYQAGTDGKDIGVWDWTCLNNDSAAALVGKFVPSLRGCASGVNLPPQPRTNVTATIE